VWRAPVEHSSHRRFASSSNFTLAVANTHAARNHSSNKPKEAHCLTNTRQKNTLQDSHPPATRKVPAGGEPPCVCRRDVAAARKCHSSSSQRRRRRKRRRRRRRENAPQSDARRMTKERGDENVETFLKR